MEVGEVGSLRIVISAELQSTINARRCNSSLKYQPSLIMPHYVSCCKNTYPIYVQQPALYFNR